MPYSFKPVLSNLHGMDDHDDRPNLLLSNIIYVPDVTAKS